MPFAITNTLSIGFLGLTVTIFTFAITLLGNAIEKSKEEETETKIKKKEEFEKKIEKIEKEIKEAKKTGDTDDLYTELEVLIKTKDEFDEKINQISRKYSYLSFKKTVAYPTIIFIFAIILNYFAEIFYTDTHIYLGVVFWLLSILLIGIGVYRLIKTLQLVEDVSASSNRFQYQRLKEALKEALAHHEEENKEKADIELINKLPIDCQVNSDIEIKYRIKLLKGKKLENLSVWFFIPDGFILVVPDENSSWRQSKDTQHANMRTIKDNIGTVSIGPFTPSSIKIKSPKDIGIYKIFYRIYADGYKSEEKELEIGVK